MGLGEEADFGGAPPVCVGSGDGGMSRLQGIAARASVCGSQAALLTSGRREAKLTRREAPASQPQRSSAAGQAGPLPRCSAASCQARPGSRPKSAGSQEEGKGRPCQGTGRVGAAPAFRGEPGTGVQREGGKNKLSSRNSGPRRDTRPGLGALDSQPGVH